jgi:ribosomal protein S8
MVFVNLAHVCSHLQNASRARLSLTSIPMTKMHLSLCLAMQKQGLLSTVQVAGLKPPIPDMEKAIPASAREELEDKLDEEPWLGLDYASTQSHKSETAHKRTTSSIPDPLLAAKKTSSIPSPKPSDYRSAGVPINPAQRRIWLGLKYWNNEPVLKNMSLVSKPTREVRAKVNDLRKLIAGRKAGITNPMYNPGDCMFVSTEIGIMEAREAVERVRGGVLLVRTGQ